MTTHEDIYYRAILARDARFDGKFFTGVKTTGIYCRPICPARPLRKNVEFFSTALAAEKQGYRPCLRCRPECAPLSPAWIGKSSTVQRALRLISNNALFDSNEDRFAEQLGMSARHLRRLFEKELGKTPKQIYDGNRVGFARKLVTETSLSITDIVESSGYNSIRRFNDAFQERFQHPPSHFRKTSTVPSCDSGIELTLSYRPPFDWDSLLAFYRAHAIPGCEEVTDTSYERVFKSADFISSGGSSKSADCAKIGGTGKSSGGVKSSSGVSAIRLTNDEKKSRLRLNIFNLAPASLYSLSQKIRVMFDLDSDPVHVENILLDCEIMAPLAHKYPGLRIPRGWDAFETAVSGILGQLVSLKQALQLMKELAENYGEKVINPLSGKTNYFFPTPETLARETLSRSGTTGLRKEAIRELSRQVIDNKIHFNSSQDTLGLRERLLSIRGIGEWTADVICLRAVGDTNAFPAGDLILKRVLQDHPSLNTERFSPWRAYVAIYLWREFA